jgi:Skp family chaperone for outer membrane proteins
MKFLKLTAAALSLALGASVAMAQTATTPAAPVAPKPPVAATAPAPTAPAAAATAVKKGAPAMQAKTEEGRACSAEADAKNIHGKERKKFRAACMKGKTAAAVPTTPPAKRN